MKLSLFYDGECPFCNRYADILKLKNSYDVEICDARTDLRWKQYKQNIKLDDGVIVIYENRCYQGVEALDIFLGICKYKGIFFSLQRIVFSNQIIGNIVYSCFKFFRKVALVLQCKD